jgi:hypothetical protein
MAFQVIGGTPAARDISDQGAQGRLPGHLDL